MLQTILGVIADDFTGATDIASLIAKKNVPVSIRVGIPEELPLNSTSVEVIALKCRTSSLVDAKKQVDKAFQWLKKAQAKHFYWKYCSTFDSTQEGNIGPIAEKLMTDLNVDHTIFCPAFPKNGRTVYMGNLFVDQIPLSESHMRDHPLTPMRDSNLLRLLNNQVNGSVGLIDANTIKKGVSDCEILLKDFINKGIKHIIFDTISNEDLSTIGSVVKNMILLTGSSALASELIPHYKKKFRINFKKQEVSTSSINKNTIILSGSCSKITNLQVANYKSTGAPCYQLDPLDIKLNGVNKLIEWLKAQNFKDAPLLYATTDPESVKKIQNQFGVIESGQLIEETLAHCARVAFQNDVRRFIVAGGETAGAITNSLNIKKLDIGNEISTGVPWTFTKLNDELVALTLKSGNFGSENFFSDAIKALK